jgi:hypothetical protein
MWFLTVLNDMPSLPAICQFDNPCLAISSAISRWRCVSPLLSTAAVSHMESALEAAGELGTM